MEEKKCRRRSLRNLRRSSSNWVVPSEAVLRGIEIERENMQIISAYGSAWLGENTVQDIITYGERRSEEEPTKRFFPALDDCATDEMPLPSKVMRNSDCSQPPCESRKEMQCSNDIEFENSHNYFAAISGSSSPLVQDSEKVKLSSILNNNFSVVDHKRAQNANLSCTSSSSSKVSLKNQKGNDARKLKPQKKEVSSNLSFDLQQAKAKPNGPSREPPSFLKTTQSFVLKHSVAKNTQSVKSSINCVRTAKSTKVGNLPSPSKTGHFVTIQSKPLLSPGVRKDVRPDSQNSTSKLKAVKPATSKDRSICGEKEKPKSRKRLSLKKGITAAEPDLGDSIIAGSSSSENDKGLKGNSSDTIQFLANSVKANSPEIVEKHNIHNSVSDQIFEDLKTFKSGDFDIEMTEELLKSFDLPLFPSSDSIQQTKEKDTRKSLLRTSRYFSPFEMPLSKPSLEDDHESLDSLGTSVEDSPFTATPSDKEKSTIDTTSDKEKSMIDLEPTSLKELLIEDCPNKKSTIEDPAHHMTPVHNTCVESHVCIDPEVSPLCDNNENKENMTEENNKMNSRVKSYFYEANTNLIDEMMDHFKNMSVVEALKGDEKLQVNEKTLDRSFDISFDVNCNRKDSEAIIPHDAALPNGITQPEYSGQRSPGNISTAAIEDQVEMMELTSDKNTICYTDSEVEMIEHDLCPNEPLPVDDLDSNVFDTDSVSSFNVKRNLRARKSWDFSQTAKPQEGKSARKRNSDGPSSASSRSKKRPAESRASAPPKGAEKEISPGLRDLYMNKNYVLPKAKMWETIKESPPGEHSIFTKQKYKRFLQFEAGVTTAKLQRRHKKAAEVKKKLGGQTVALSDEEFRRKLLDVQLLLDE